VIVDDGLPDPVYGERGHGENDKEMKTPLRLAA
jgi:hypothetical protein